MEQVVAVDGKYQLPRNVIHEVLDRKALILTLDTNFEKLAQTFPKEMKSVQISRGYARGRVNLINY